MKDTLPKETINSLMQHGFNVYMRNRNDSYAYVESEEEGICYIQYELDGTYSLSTVHRPNRETGTGYRLYSALDRITPALIHEAIRISVPSWSRGSPPSYKYKNMEEYRSADKWNAGLRLIDN